MAAWLDLFRRRADDWLYTPIRPPHCPSDGVRRTVRANEDYISIYLMSMRIVNVRTGLKSLYGVVNSYARVSHQSGTAAEFNVVISPDQLKNIDSTRLDRVIQMEHRILGPVPFRKELELETGLFSVAARDMAGEFLALLSEASKLAGIAYVGSALPYVGLIKSGLEMLLGGNASLLEIGLSREFTQPETGYFVVMRVPKGQVNEALLRIDPNDYRLHYPDPNLVRTAPYMVFRISASPQRDDWYEIPDISAAYNTLMNAVRNHSFSAVKDTLGFFKRIVRTSPDLVTGDAERLVGKVEKLVADTMGPTQTAGGRERSLPSLGELKLYE